MIEQVIPERENSPIRVVHLQGPRVKKAVAKGLIAIGCIRAGVTHIGLNPAKQTIRGRHFGPVFRVDSIVKLAILKSAMQHVASAGILLYSTCSLEPEENQTVVEAALSEDISFRLAPIDDQLNELRSQGELAWKDAASLVSGPYLRTIPGVHPCDGFFAAVLQKEIMKT